MDWLAVGFTALLALFTAMVFFGLSELGYFK